MLPELSYCSWHSDCTRDLDFLVQDSGVVMTPGHSSAHPVAGTGPRHAGCHTSVYMPARNPTLALHTERFCFLFLILHSVAKIDFYK